MRKVLFIANFNSVMKEINAGLTEYFQIQVCSANQQTVKGMLSMYEPEAIVVCLTEIDSAEAGLFDIIAEKSSEVPVLIIGTEHEARICQKYLSNNTFAVLYRPTLNQRIVERLFQLMGCDPSEEIDRIKSENDSRKHILCVDDDAIILRGLKKMIPEQYRVSVANSGTKAIFMLEQDKPDLIFLDYEMPILDGKKTLEMIRSQKEFAGIPVVFLTGLGERKYIESVLELKPAGYILKPPLKDNIVKTIQKILG